jgi:hypothetical protein
VESDPDPPAQSRTVITVVFFFLFRVALRDCSAIEVRRLSATSTAVKHLHCIFALQYPIYLAHARADMKHYIARVVST